MAFKAVTAAVPSILFDTGFSLWNSWGFFKSYGLAWGSSYLSGCFGSQRSEGRNVRGDRCVFVPTLLVLSSKPSIAGYNFAFVPGPQLRIVWFPQLHSINHVPSIVEIQYPLFDQSETLAAPFYDLIAGSSIPTPTGDDIIQGWCDLQLRTVDHCEHDFLHASQPILSLLRAFIIRGWHMLLSVRL